MAELKCKALNCSYNKDSLCSKGDIMVGGQHATTKEDTCCESFIERKGDSFSSAISHPSQTISIDCEACKCTYNSNYKCYAQHVDIDGSCACTSSGTACATFKQEQP